MTATDPTRLAGVHALFWLVVANGVGLLLAALLLWPDLNLLFGPLTHGRWVPVHLNLQLYGWTSLPLVAWLLHVYGANDAWAAGVVWAWSGALVCGSASWLAGHVTGKIFLDWKGAALAAFIAAMLLLWTSLARGLWRRRDSLTASVRVGQCIGLCLLAPVPVLFAWASRPEVYPQFDHTTGGPTGSSLLGSTLSVIVLLLLLPRSWPLAHAGKPSGWLWWIVALETLVFLVLESRGGTHWQSAQIFALGLLLPWPVLLWRDWRRFSWPRTSWPWLRWTTLWWTILVLSGWALYLPGILDRLKFTDGLVAHAHLAMAGFTSAFGAAILSLVFPETELGSPLTRWAWNFATLALIAVLGVAGWLEGRDLSWTTDPPALRHVLYALRLIAGAAMFFVSVAWWRSSFLLKI